jgi:putative DNA primase/helicase
MSNTDQIIYWALKGLDAGWAVFPLREAEKIPMYPGGCLEATRSRARVVRHWMKHPRHNYGIATGSPSGIFVIDIDGPNGERSWQALFAKHGPPPPTLTVITANGRHLYFKTKGLLIGNSVGKLGAGIDVRGERGYVVGAGSVHPSGHVYRYAN